jgi:hypothetical protein
MFREQLRPKFCQAEIYKKHGGSAIIVTVKKLKLNIGDTFSPCAKN